MAQRFFLPIGFLLVAAASFLRSGVVISEFQAAPNEVLPDFDAQGMPHLGYGPSWWEAGFYDGGWSAGTAPLGHSLASGLGTNVGTAMDDKTPVLYTRKTFTVSAAEAAGTADLMLRVWYDDGFVAFLNGREVARANMGPAGQVSYHHQVSYRAGTADAQPVEYNLGPVNTRLVAGVNVLAVEVHNRDLGGSCKVDAALYSASPAVTTVLREFDFDDGNGALRTHERTGATVTNTGTGVPPPGSWLLAAPDPISDSGWPSLTIGTRLTATGGVLNSGALEYTLTQGAAGSLGALLCGPPVDAGGLVVPGAVSAGDLGRMEVSFRYRMSAGANFGFRIDPVPGAAGQVLTGFPNVTVAGGAAEDAAKEFADASNGSRTRTVNSTGTGTTASSGIVRYSPVLENGPALRNAAFRYNESNVAGAGNGGGTGALKFEMTDAPDAPEQVDWYQFSIPGLTVRGWTAGAVTVADLARMNFTFAWNLPAGQSFRVFLQPDNASATYADRADFGVITGNGGWQVFDQPFSAATNTAAMLTRLNALGTTAFRVYFRNEGTLPVNTPLWVDSVGFSSLWRSYSAVLSSAGAASQTAFLAAMNGAGQTVFSPVFTKISSAISPAQDVLTLDEFRVTYRTGGTDNWVSAAGTGWRYFVGRHQPNGGFADPGEFSDPLYDGDVRDWLELHNDGPAAVNLTGWSLTDDAALPQKWVFPNGTTLLPGGYLVVICDGRTAPLAGAQFLHTNFELSTDGEHLTLRDNTGAVVSDVSGYSKQNGWHTWGRNPSGPDYGYLRHGTPGRANSGPFYAARAKTPDFTPPGGFYTGTQSVSIVSETPGAVIRYTTDGSDPGLTSPVYSAPLTLNAVSSSAGHVLRAKAWMAGGIASETKTATFLINQDSRLRTAPALIFTGDPGRAMFAPYGITAIVGGTRDASTGVWSPVGTADYNNVLGDLNNALTGGQAWERPFNVEWRYADGRDGFNEAAGLRVSGSGHARPRYTLTNIQNAPWSATSYLEKPSFNVFFRNEYDKPGVTQKMFPGSYPVDYFEQLRVRAGKNDVSNPFVKDEFMRRLYIEMGRQGSRGVFNTLYVNGKFRGVYNTTERLREPFMQQHFNSTAEWDVRQVTEIANGDGTAFTQFVALLDAFNTNQTQANYDAAVAQLDVPAYIDYALVNIWGGTGDWPHNNYVASRERSTTGKWRWFVWDAEGAFGGFNKHLGYNVITQDFLVNPTGTGREICRTYERLSKNADFRLQFADRIHRHFCNGGALSDARLTALKDGVVGEYQPLFNFILPTGTLSTSWFTNWVHMVNLDKRDVLFRSAMLDDPATAGVVDLVEFGYQFPKANVWPSTDGQGTWMAPHPPKFSQHGGDVVAGYALTISHTEPDDDRTKSEPYRAAANQTPANRVIYFTVDGSDPRTASGAVSAAALAWTAPVALPGSFVVVKSRIRDTANGEWSPITEANFRIGAQPPSAATLVIAEMMYNPPGPTAAETGWTDGDEFEFIRLQNVGPHPVRLNEVRFTAGIGFDFAAGAVPVLEPGQSVFLVANAAAFRARYGNGFDSRIAGEYTGTNLSNGGERLRMETASGATLHDFAYDDTTPWPATADGLGPSLMLLNPQEAPDHAIPGNWTASALPGGLLNPVVQLPMTYARWRSLFWTVADNANHQSAEGGDWDADGITNIEEYGLGTNPRLPGIYPVTPFTGTVGSDTVVGIEYRVMAASTGVIVTAQSSPDMTQWSSAPQYAPANQNGDGSYTRRAYFAPNGSVKGFLRLKFQVD